VSAIARNENDPVKRAAIQAAIDAFEGNRSSNVTQPSSDNVIQNHLKALSKYTPDQFPRNPEIDVSFDSELV
jgi:hypothetical protein